MSDDLSGAGGFADYVDGTGAVGPGTTTGGFSSGGMTTGGSEAGGSATGGVITSGGSFATGGDVGTGGASTGGASTGGASTGGASTGGASTGGASTGGSGTGGGGSCDVPPAASSLVGWAAVSGNGTTTTTGGGSATPVTVTTLAALKSAVSGTGAGVVYVKGKLAPGDVSIGSNKTIVGLCGAEIHGHLELSGSVNVIIRNIAVVGYGVGNCALDPDYDSSVGCSSGADAISVQKNAHHIWFDHCSVSDGTDGNLDITNGANYVTVSWTKFFYTARTDNEGDDSTGAAGHRFSNLIGGTDSPKAYDDANALNVTWHHNWWANNVVERQARVRFGNNHFFNNFWNSTTSNYCVRAGKAASVHLENNYFKGVKDAHEFNSTTDKTTAFISRAGNVYDGTSGVQEIDGGGTKFTPSGTYSYSAEAASGVPASVQAGAGPK